MGIEEDGGGGGRKGRVGRVRGKEEGGREE